jgi:thiol-disulfide isomerase/thioredoxin
MRLLTVFLILLVASPVFGQAHRVPPSGPVVQTATVAQTSDGAASLKQMYEEASGFLKARISEFEAKKVPFSETLLNKTKLEQRQLAAKYAAAAGTRADVAGDDLYYLGMLHWLAENFDGTIANLWKFVSITDADASRKQTARSVLAVVLAKQKKLDEAESLLAEYLKNEPKKQTERARMESELAQAYQAQKDFVRMAPHAEEDYKAAKALLGDNTSRARGLDEILNAGMLVFEAWQGSGNRAKADSALEDMRVTGAETGSPAFYYFAVDRKVRYLIETGRKAQAMEFYSTTLSNIGRDFSLKELENDAATRLKKKEKHYKLLGESAPEFAAVDQWFPGERKTFADLKGKVVLLDFWATWCGPCLEAFPSLIEWKQEFGRDGFEILGVTRYYGNVRGMPADKASELEFLKGYRTHEDLPYPFVVSDGQGLQSQYGAMSLPTAVLIDRKGVVRYIDSGTSASGLAQLREMIIRLLAEK